MHFFFFLLISSRLLAVEGRAAEKRVQFVDVAEEVGVVAQNVSGDSEQTYLVDSMMGGSAFFDYDQDGDVDLYILNGSKVVGFPDQEHPRNTFYRNEHGKFVDATDEANLGDAGWGMGCAVGDYNNDGDLDIYITNYGRNVLYDNQNDGTFVDVTEYAQVGDERFSTGCAFLDYDGDGYLDLYVANYVDFKHFLQTTPNKSYIWKGLRVHFGPRGMKGSGDTLYQQPRRRDFCRCDRGGAGDGPR